MRRVGVVGSGRAGAAAALEAAARGASVEVFERRPPLLRSGEKEKALESAGVEVLRGLDVLEVGTGPSLKTRGRSRTFDGVVVAVGSTVVFPRLPGIGKAGVHLLGDGDDFGELASQLPSVQLALVWGGGLHALRVADKLRGQGRAVSLVLSHWPPGLSRGSPVADALADAAREAGVSLLQGTPQRVVGLGEARAVVCGGKVVPCDAFVCLPTRVPSAPPAGLRLSSTGSILVDGELRTSIPSIFGAGSCVEVLGSPQGALLSSVPSGRVAGANSAGAEMAYRELRSWSATIFGLGVTVWGMDMEEAIRAGHRAACTTRVWGRGSACTVVYDEPSGRVIGVQLSGESLRGSSGSLVLPEPLDLRALAYLGVPDSTDISPVSETARQGLR